MDVVNLKQNYVAAMILSGVGDALGFRNGMWESCSSGEEIFLQVLRLGGLDKIEVKLPEWRVSDDTVMHIATANALVKHKPSVDKKGLFKDIATEYKNCMSDMAGRNPGTTCIKSCEHLHPENEGGCSVPFNSRGGGCGAAMRSMCIGLMYPRPEQLRHLIEVSIESGRMTHHHPSGYLGSLASALFGSYAIQKKPVKEWGIGLMETLPAAKKHIIESGRYVSENLNAWDYFENSWKAYLRLRNIHEKINEPDFPIDFSFRKRDRFYSYISFDGVGGSSGHDAPIIAYDALLGCGGDWNELCSRAMFHGGDSDSTGAIAGFLFGAIYEFSGVSESNYKKLEYRANLETLALKLLEINASKRTEEDTQDSDEVHK